MRAKGINVPQVLLGLALLGALCWNLAHAGEIKDLRVASGATGTRAEFALARQTPVQVLSLAHPDRLVVDLRDTELARGLTLPAPAGLIKAVRSGHPVPGTTRIVFDLAAPVVALKPRFEAGPDGDRLVIEWPGDSAPGTARPVAARPADARPDDAIARIAAASRTTPQATTLADAVPAPAAVTTAMNVPATAPEPDPAVASAAATARLVAATLPPAPATTTTSATAAQPAASEPTPAPPRAEPMPAASGTIATGIPTRIATGVPTRLDPVDGTPVAAATASPDAAPPPSRRRPWIGGMRPLIIAIDPGHGGQDPGAIGPTGKREKDVTLAIGRELARQINAMPGLKAYMTRDTDVFIPLNRRAQLARAAKADIFVSVHADAAENRSANGSSVYVLSLKGASSQRARWLADKENAADLIGGRLPAADNTLASVLLDLTQSGHMRASEDAAGHVLSGLGRIGSNHKSGIERANFAVLRTSDMPSMLVETAFISNPDEERRLTSADYQRTLARAVLGGIDAYFLQQPPPGTMYAARASAGTAMTAAAASGVSNGGP